MRSVTRRPAGYSRGDGAIEEGHDPIGAGDDISPVFDTATE